jgi:hypothetical protein
MLLIAESCHVAVGSACCRRWNIGGGTSWALIRAEPQEFHIRESGWRVMSEHNTLLRGRRVRQSVPVPFRGTLERVGHDRSRPGHEHRRVWSVVSEHGGCLSVGGDLTKNWVEHWDRTRTWEVMNSPNR